MKSVINFGLLTILVAFGGAHPLGLAFQASPGTPSSVPHRPNATALQQLLDRDDYIGCYKALGQIDPARFTEAQRQYFLGMMSFHLGHLNDNAAPAPALIKALESKDKSLTPNQIESALETLGQINIKLTNFGASAQNYDAIDKAFGSQLGENEKAIRGEGHLVGLLKSVPRQTIEFSGDFTLARRGLEYPVNIPHRQPDQQPSKPFFAVLDTGAEISVLSASTAKAWGVTMLDGSATLHGYGGGAFSGQPGFLPALVIGKAELHNVAVYVTADSNLYIPEIKRQTNALLGYSVVSALGRLTFAKDGSLTVSAQSPARDLRTSATLWLSDHSLLVGLGTKPIVSDGKVTGGGDTRLFVLDTGSGSTWLTDHYLAEHADVFHGQLPEVARLSGAGGLREIPAFAVRNAPLFAGDTVILLNGPHVLSQPAGGEAEQFFGVLGQDVLGLFSSYTVDFRNMTFTIQR
jgi:Aspartyl protease